jgi:hypothetical protein
MASDEYRHYKDLGGHGLEAHHLNLARAHIGRLHALQEEIRAEELLAKIEGEAREAQRVASMKMRERSRRRHRRQTQD